MLSFLTGRAHGIRRKEPQQTWYLKRRIGLPGDVVRIEDRVVYVNDRKQDNPPHAKFLRAMADPAGEPNPDIFPAGARTNADNYGPVIVPKKGMSVILTPKTLPPWKVFIEREGHSALNMVATCVGLPRCDDEQIGDHFAMAGQRYFSTLETHMPVFKTDNFYSVCTNVCKSKSYAAKPARSLLCGY